MTARTKTLWTFVITSVALFMVTLDNLVVTTAIPVIREDLDASLESLEWTVNAYTLTFAVLLLTGAALGDRFGRRRMFAIGLGIFTVARSPRRSRRRSRRSTSRARVQGARRRDRDAAHADDPQRRRAGRRSAGSRSAPGAGSAASPSPSARSSAARSSRGSRGSGSSGSTCRSGSCSIPLALLAPDREPRARAAGSTCRASGSPAPACSGSSGASCAATAQGWTSPEIVALARARRRLLVVAFVALGAARARRRCCRCASSATGRSRSRTSPRCSCSSGCSARSSCSRSSSRPCRATRRSASGLRILPWTLDADVHRADRGRAVRPASAGQRAHRHRAGAAGGRARVDRARSRRRRRRTRRSSSRSSSPASAWRSSSRRSRTSSSRPCGRQEEGQASGANNAIRELGGVFGVAVLAVGLRELSAATRAARRSSTG